MIGGNLGMRCVYIEALIYASATMVTIMNPKILVLGGGVIEHNPELIEIVRKRISDYALLASCEGLRVEKSRMENASLEGAKILLRASLKTYIAHRRQRRHKIS